jgi:high-affinity iron transporter
MLLTAVIIVLREVLEAALLISILAALSGALGIRRYWIGGALAAGLAGAIVIAGSLDTITAWLDGAGQEVLNAAMQALIYLLLGMFICLLILRGRARTQSGIGMKLIMTAAVGLATAREGSEILIYASGFVMNLPQLMSVLIGTSIGAGIGISAGALLYYLLVSLNDRWSRRVGAGLLVLVAAGLLSQATLLLTQADWLPAGLPLWDSSALIAERSVTGQLLYAMIGYEATPDAFQAAGYFGGGILLLCAALIAVRYRRRAGDHP